MLPNVFIPKQLYQFFAVLAIAGTAFSTTFNIPSTLEASRSLSDPLEQANTYFNGIKNIDPDTIHVMALRVEFVPDSLSTTTGDGRFDFSSDSDYIIDPPPHNKLYFEHQLLALKNYFATVSNNHLIIQYQVFPPEVDQAYQLAHDMVYYSGEEDEERQKLRWAELLRDGIAAAESRDHPDFSQFDTFIIYHAGVGRDFAFDFTETPFDIQSAYIDFESLRETIGEGRADFQGIAAGTTFIRHGIILPEQQNQKGINLGLLGTSTLLIGSHIGMPSLFQTETGRPGIGTWGLMDQGSFNYFGLIPAQPSAWEKLYMGWEEAVEVPTLQEAVLGTAGTTSAPHLIKVPINQSEYFLLENRQEDWDGDGITYGRDENGVRVKFDSLGNIVAESGLGVITHIDEYDYGLPGSGILIWHIDDNVIRQNLASNTINNDPDHRGVDLVECDGPQDIGQQYSMFTPGYGTETGDYWDAWWSGNISHKYINGERPVEFSSSSIPASYGHNRTVTHIRISNFSDKDTLMTFRISNDWYTKGFPQYTGATFGEGALTYVTLRGGNPAIVAVSQDGKIFGWRTNGEKIIENELTVETETVDGRTRVLPFALMGKVGSPVSLPPVIVDYQNDDVDDILIIDDNGALSVWSTNDQNSDGLADQLLQYSADEKFTVPFGLVGAGTETGRFYRFVFDGAGKIVGGESQKIAETAIVAAHVWQGEKVFYVFAAEDGKIVALDAETGEAAWETQAFGSGDRYYLASLSPSAVADGTALLVAISNDGYVTVIDSNGSILNSERRITSTGPVSAPAIGDADGDGEAELILASEEMLHVIELPSAASTINFPQRIENQNHPGHLSAPLWFSIKGNKTASHTIVAVANGQILSFDASGTVNDGFPLSAGGAVNGSPLLLNVEDEEHKEVLVAASNDGYIYAWNLNVIADNSWRSFGGDSQQSFRYSAVAEPVASANDLMPGKKVFCYPNPVEEGYTFIRYTLNEPVESVTISIYDIAGMLVAQLPGPGIEKGDHEVVWDVTNIQSGAYIARVKAQTMTQNAVEFIKIAVVK